MSDSTIPLADPAFWQDPYTTLSRIRDEYRSGVTDHRIQDDDLVDHLVRLVENKAAEIEAEMAEEATASAAVS